MTEQEMLARDIDTMLESIKLYWQDIASKNPTAEDYRAIKGAIKTCERELRDLLQRRDSLKSKP